jgi:hypothetical protein
MLIEEYPAQMTMQEYYASLPSPWDVPVPEYGPIKELHKVRSRDQEKFTGDRLQYAAWRRRFFAIVHTKRMIVSEKALALSTALDTKVEILKNVVRRLNYDARTYAVVIRELERLYGGAKAEISLSSTELIKGPKVMISSLDSVRTFRVKLSAYSTTLDTHGQRQTEFALNSNLYREIMHSWFNQPDLVHFHEQRVAKGWPASPEGMLTWLDMRQTVLEAAEIGIRAKTPLLSADHLNTAFMTTTDEQEETTFPAAVHEMANDEESYFHVYDDTPPEIVQQMLNISRHIGRQNFVHIMSCEWKGQECTTTHLLRYCLMFKKLKPRERMTHLQKCDQCLHCMKKGHRSRECESSITCSENRTV